MTELSGENTRKQVFLKIILIIAPFIAFFISLSCGRYFIPFDKSMKIFFSSFMNFKGDWSRIEESIIINLRIPRVLLAMLIGAGLSVSGASFQGIFRNPLVSPHLLGVAAAAGFGGILGMIFLKNSIAIFVLAFVFGIVSVLIAFFFSREGKTTSMLMLVLSGVIVGSFFTALISLLKYIADPVDELPSIVFWLMGSFSTASYSKLLLVGPPIIVCIIILYLLRWRINILSLGDEEAEALGLPAEFLKWMIIIPVTIIVSLSVSVSGIIGWVGLAIPHITRMIVGPDHKVLIPATISLGAVYLVFIDDISRTLTAAEIPLGILTAIIGIVIFGFLLKSSKGGGWVES